VTSKLNLLQAGISATHKRQYAQAVELLETFCRQNTVSKPSEYFEAQRWLIKAYQRNGQVNLAIYLCQQMLESPNHQTRVWAKSNLEWLQEELELSAADNDRYPPTLDPQDPTLTTPTSLDRSSSAQDFTPLTAESLAYIDLAVMDVAKLDN
jgi:pentatricopeptide repeat protein